MTNPITSAVGDDERRRIRLNELDAVDEAIFVARDYAVKWFERRPDQLTEGRTFAREIVISTLDQLREFIQTRRDRA